MVPSFCFVILVTVPPPTRRSVSVASFLASALVILRGATSSLNFLSLAAFSCLVSFEILSCAFFIARCSAALTC